MYVSTRALIEAYKFKPIKMISTKDYGGSGTSPMAQKVWDRLRGEGRLNRPAGRGRRAAKGPTDLPAGWRVQIYSDERGPSVFITLRDGRDQRIGHLQMIRYVSCGGAWVVTNSEAPSGWGPMLYDLGLEWAGSTGVMPDRGSVSPAAAAVWTHYLRQRRNDVEWYPVWDDPTIRDAEACGEHNPKGTPPSEREALDYRFVKKGRSVLPSLQARGALKIKERGRRAYKFPSKPKPWVSPHMEQLREDLYAAGVPRSTDIRIEAYPPGDAFEGFKVEMHDESAPAPVQYGLMSYFRATRVNEKGFEWNQAPRECYDALERLRRKQPHIQGIWVVPGAELFDPRLRGKGIGRVMYRHALEAADRAGAALVPHECLGGGTTSPAAKKAWKALPGASEGPLHYLPRKRGEGRLNREWFRATAPGNY